MNKEVILRNKKDSKQIRQCRVVFSYKQDHEDELNLKVGDIINIIGEEEEGWWRGILNGKIGVFPSNFVEEIDVKSAVSKENINEEISISNKTAKILCEVKFSYTAQNEDELSLKEGDVITLLSKDGQDPGWWKGELNGDVGVFPDNFVTILPYGNSDSISSIITQDKVVSIASQRKSLETKLNHIHDISDDKSPPIPNKKPIIGIKKTSSSNSSSKLFSDIKKKIIDTVDGATSTKHAVQLSVQVTNETTVNTNVNVFDQVERVPLLADVRATRPKAPAGRRPPSMAFHEEELITIPLSSSLSHSITTNGVMSETLNLEVVSEQIVHSENDEITEVKPKLREWEKHKAPWLAEMKLNQAKRTSPLPSSDKPDKSDKIKSSTEKQDEEIESEMSKSTPSLNTTPISSKNKFEGEKVPLRPKPNFTNIQTPRPSSIQSSTTSTDVPQKPPTLTKNSPINRTPSPSINKFEKSTLNNENEITISVKHYTELLDRMQRLELLVEKQNMLHIAAVEDLKNKLQLETEMRHMLQVQLEKVIPSNLMQV